MYKHEYVQDFEGEGPVENAPLVNDTQAQCCAACADCCEYFCACNSQKNRMAHLNGSTIPGHFPRNKISNQKYNLFTFFPKVLWNQFSQFYNLFFLLICVSQFFSILAVGFAFTYVVPLVFVITITIFKEAYDDFKRYIRDNEINGEKYLKLSLDGKLNEIKSADVKVGDIIQIKEGQRVPADVVLLYTTGKNGMLFIKTDQLDGETDWKLRKAVNQTQAAYESDTPLTQLNGYVNAEVPHKDIYKFHGTFYFDDGLKSPPAGLDLSNTLWADTVITTGFALGLVIYTGSDTKAQQNARAPRSKLGKIDEEISWMSFILFLVLIVLSFILVTANGFKGQWYVLLMRYLLLLSSIIPISLRVNLDLAKTWYSLGVSSDKAIPGTVARNMTIPEDLGRIEMLLSDKTGTLTQNEMELKECFVDNAKYIKKESFNELLDIVRESASKDAGPLADLEQIEQNRRRHRSEQIKDLVLAMAICHNVTPVEKADGKEYQAASPDEVALVRFADELGYHLIYRDQISMKIKTPNDEVDEYEILTDFPFTSESKRMGIVVKHVKSKRIVYFLKGAEQAVEVVVNQNSALKMKEGAEDMSLEGLRTLSFTEKFLTEEQYSEWSKNYSLACAAEYNREEEKAIARGRLESNMEYLGVTGVEDKLQENVAKTLEALKQAGIKVWMLTGDKIETASCIGISSGLKSRSEKYCTIKEVAENKLIIENELKKVERQKSAVLVIDGISLDRCLNFAEKLFFEVTTKLPGVMCCRCSPTQKTTITKKLKLHTNMKIAAVGDGGNDVGMIQEADVGIGIAGKEGKQAFLAADYALFQFHYISRLLLWHGRLSYLRTSNLSQFIVHRGLIIAIIQMLFSLTFYFCAIPVFNCYLQLGYSTYYTFLPVFSLVFDQDVENEESVLKFPNLYRNLQKGRFFSAKTCFVWIAQSLYQGVVVIMCTLIFFEDSFVNIVIINFSALICIEMLNLYSVLQNPTRMTFLFVVLSILAYVSSLFFFREYFSLNSVDKDFMLKILATTLISWVPVHFLKCCAEKLDPSEAVRVERMSV